MSHFTRVTILVWKQVRNNREILIGIEFWRKIKQWHKEWNMKNINCVPKVVGRSIKKLFFKISQYSQENNCVGVSFLIKIQTFRPVTLLKEDSNTVVLLKYLAKIFKKSYFEEHLWTTISESFSFYIVFLLEQIT